MGGILRCDQLLSRCTAKSRYIDAQQNVTFRLLWPLKAPVGCSLPVRTSGTCTFHVAPSSFSVLVSDVK